MDTARQMKTPIRLAAALSALLAAAPLGAADPEDAVGVERGKYGDPNALVTVTFGFGRNELTDAARAVLDDFAVQMVPGQAYEVGGHTDSIGDEAYNQWLSEQRASAVRRYLVGLGAEGASLGVTGYGESQPVDSNRTLVGRQRNRRVVIRLAP
jgi:outer membrane protein OmpA-like peptidoglycan-associated protein